MEKEMFNRCLDFREFDVHIRAVLRSEDAYTLAARRSAGEMLCCGTDAQAGMGAPDPSKPDSWGPE